MQSGVIGNFLKSGLLISHHDTRSYFPDVQNYTKTSKAKITSEKELKTY